MFPVVHNYSETLSFSSVRDASAELEIIRSKHGLPAIAGVVVRGDRAVFEGASGLRKFGHESKVTIHDRFHAGSITKSMTATLAALIVESGKIQWNTTIQDVFGKTEAEIHPNYRSVTLEQLLSHRGGALSNLRASYGRPLGVRMEPMKTNVSSLCEVYWRMAL